jgi:hypothetical protein
MKFSFITRRLELVCPDLPVDQSLSALSGWLLLTGLEPSVDFLLLGSFCLTDFQGCSSGIELNSRFVSAHGTELPIDNLLVQFFFLFYRFTQL